MASADAQPFTACPAAEEAVKAFSVGGLRTAQCSWCLRKLGVAPGRNLTEQRAELIRVFGLFPNYARASLWLFLARADGIGSPAHAVSDLLPATLDDGATEPLCFDPPNGVDLESTGIGFAHTQVIDSPASQDGSPHVPRRQPRQSPGSASPQQSPDVSPTASTPGSRVGFDAVLEVPSTEDLTNPAHAAAFLRQLGLQQSIRVQQFDSRVQGAAVNFAHAQNIGQTTVVPLAQQLTAKQRHEQTKYAMHSRSQIADWKRGSGDETYVNLLGDTGPTTQSLRDCIFECNMRREDRTKLLSNCPRPDIWSHAPELGAGDRAIFGAARIKKDDNLRERQDAKCKQMAPLLLAIHTLGRCSATCDALLGEPHTQLHHELAEVGKYVSAAFHLLAYDVSEMQRDRKSMALQAYSGVDALKVDLDAPDDATWSLVSGGRVEAGVDLLKVAEQHRKAHRELSQVKRPFRQGGSGEGQHGQGQSRSAKRRRAAKNRTNGGGNNNKGDANNSKKGGRARGGGRGRGRGRGRGGGRGRGRGGGNDNNAPERVVQAAAPE